MTTPTIKIKTALAQNYRTLRKAEQNPGTVVEHGEGIAASSHESQRIRDKQQFFDRRHHFAPTL